MPTVTSTWTGNGEWFVSLMELSIKWSQIPGLLFLLNLPELRLEF